MRQPYSIVALVACASLALGLGASACVDRSDVGTFGPDAGAPSNPDGAAPASEGGTPSDAMSPITVKLAASTTPLAAGGLSTCGIDANGGAVCWGDNQHGTLGVGSFDPTDSNTALSVMGLTKGVHAVAGGPFAQCAILDDGTALCWGDSLFGDIGGTTQSVQMPSPHDKTGLGNDVARIGFGLSFACAVTTSGQGKCWGLGGAGQLGTSRTNDEYIAKDIATREPLVNISPSMGGVFACAVTSVGKVLCWGENGAGQLGSNGTTGQPKPTEVIGLDAPAKNVACGRAHACALLADGGVACWGSDAKGEQGRGSASAGPKSPTRVPGLTGASSLAAGGAHSCVITGGRAVCWGANDTQQIASGAAALAPTEVAPASFAPIAVTAGFSHTCVMGAPRAIKCIGDASRKQTGTGSFSL